MTNHEECLKRKTFFLIIGIAMTVVFTLIGYCFTVATKASTDYFELKSNLEIRLVEIQTQLAEVQTDIEWIKNNVE